jgi:hypothetical protein
MDKLRQLQVQKAVQNRLPLIDQMVSTASKRLQLPQKARSQGQLTARAVRALHATKHHQGLASSTLD